MQITLPKEIGQDLLEHAERRGQSIDEYVDSLSGAFRNASATLVEQEPEVTLSDEDAQALMLVAQMENVLPLSWIQAWKNSSDAARTKTIAGGLLILIFYLAMVPNGPERLTELLERLAYLARLTKEEEQTRPTSPPDWLTAIQPANPAADGTNGLHRAAGNWPGDESDEEVNAALERLS
ncbi:MAG: hypothetical protein V4671_08530 [Armatimonadota bacterium]